MTKLNEFRAAEQQSRAKANRLLFTWLSDDDKRADLYRCLLESKQVLQFQSRANINGGPTPDYDPVFHQEVYLLTSREHVETALTTPEEFSNSPYSALGNGTFMLGLDDDHQKQHAFAVKYLHYDAATIDALASVAFKAAAVLPSKQRKFDLAEVSEQVALRFAGFLFGFEQVDHVLLEKTMRLAFFGLNHQIVGRHFVSEPAAITDATIAMGELLSRVAQLIDLYRARIGQAEQDEFERIGLEPRTFGRRWGSSTVATIRAGVEENRRGNFGRIKEDGVTWIYSGNELAVIVVGLIRAPSAISRRAPPLRFISFSKIAPYSPRARGCRQLAARCNQGWQVRRLHLGSAAAESPESISDPQDEAKNTSRFDQHSEGSTVILAIGAATRDKIANPDKFDERPGQLIRSTDLGGPRYKQVLHQCVGQHLAMPVIGWIARGVLLLDGLAETFDPKREAVSSEEAVPESSARSIR